MRWVNEILPPRVRFRWLLITTRLSASSLAGTARTLVAVGTVSEACMFLTTVPAAPRSCVISPGGAAAGVLGLAARDVLPAAGLLSVFAGAFAGPDPPVPEDPDWPDPDWADPDWPEEDWTDPDWPEGDDDP